MDKRYQVFVSSTFRDLQTERREVMQVLLEMDCIPAAMELFPSANEDQWTLIKNVINDCDYYIVIVGGRYGSITVDGVSYTEKEYDYAVESMKPILGFVHEDPGSISSRDSEADHAARELLDRFRDKVLCRPTRTYGTPDQLGSVVSRSLMQAMKKEPGEGWVRGRFALTAEHHEEVNRLRAELAELRLEHERQQEPATSASLFDRASLAQGDDIVQLDYQVRSVDTAGNNQLDQMQSIPYKWSNLFRIIGPELTVAFPEGSLKEAIEAQILSQRSDEIRVRHPEIQLDSASLNQVMHQFRALGYVELAENAARGRLWRLTGDGDIYLLQLFALRRPE